MTQQRIIVGDCIAGLRTLPDASVHCCVTSPPYWGLRDYGHAGQIGLEDTPEAYVARMVEVFREVRRVLRDDGTCWVNLGDSYVSTPRGNKNGWEGSGLNGVGSATYQARLNAGTARTMDKTKVAGLKPKDLVGIPWRVAFALQADGWWLRQDIIWHKPNPMPESVRDRCTKAHEYVFLLTKSERYYYDAEAIREENAESSVRRRGLIKTVSAKDGLSLQRKVGEVVAEYGVGGRNRRSVWTITTKPYSGAHFAVMPPDLVEPCIKAGTSEEGCCPACGTPWERVVERGETEYARLTRDSSWNEMDAAALQRGVITKAGEGGQTRKPNGTVPSLRAAAVLSEKWLPACACLCHAVDCDLDDDCRCEPKPHKPVPCTVLDPFAGSGTTLAVAAELGRNGIGCELNPEYVKLAEQRIDEARGKTSLFNAARCGSSAMGMGGGR